ncbi:hypothetical protein FOA52_007406 [Chlamydomonas sp. UWO 241]|nr:hypothetical protein FOA52_007406 [Chlamydomonas sp. UWO 241]
MERHLDGVLEVTLRQARGIKDVDKLGKQDPYAILTHGKQEFKSKVHTDGGKNPVWNQTFLFEQASTSFFLKLQLWDKNSMMKDKVIGECKIPLIKALKARPQDVHVVPVVTKAGTVQGEVYLNLVFVPAELKMMQLEEENRRMRVGLGGEGGSTHFARMSGMSRASGMSRVAGVSGLNDTTSREVELQFEIERLNTELAEHHRDKAASAQKDSEEAAMAANIARLGGELAACPKPAFGRAPKVGSGASASNAAAAAAADRNAAAAAALTAQPSDDLMSAAVAIGAAVSAAAAAAVSAVAVAVQSTAAGNEEGAEEGEGAEGEGGDRFSPLIASLAAKAVLKTKLQQMIDENERLKGELEKLGRVPEGPAEGAAGAEARQQEEGLTIVYPVLPIQDETDGIFSEMLEMFRDQDTDESGTITLDEFAAGLKAMGSNLTDKDILRLFKECDLDGNGSIDFQEFMTVNVERTKSECENRLISAYTHYDKDGKGAVSLDRILDVMVMTGISDLSKIKDEVARSKQKDGFTQERAMELMWHGITAQQWLMITTLPPVIAFVLSIPVARVANWFLAGGGRRMDEEEATAAAAERIAAAAEDGTSLPVRLATDVVRFLYGGTGRREPADGGVVSASLLNAKPAVGGIGVEPRGGGVLRVLFTVASDAVADTVVRWRHELRRCVDSTAVFDVLSDREEAQHQALWPAFLATKVAGKRAQFHRARLVVDGERVAAPAC